MVRGTSDKHVWVLLAFLIQRSPGKSWCEVAKLECGQCGWNCQGQVVSLGMIGLKQAVVAVAAGIPSRSHMGFPCFSRSVKDGRLCARSRCARLRYGIITRETGYGDVIATAYTDRV